MELRADLNCRFVESGEGKVFEPLAAHPHLFFRSLRICTLTNDRLIYRFLPLLL